MDDGRQVTGQANQTSREKEGLARHVGMVEMLAND
jgi:hypothetical protein